MFCCVTSPSEPTKGSTIRTVPEAIPAAAPEDDTPDVSTKSTIPTAFVANVKAILQISTVLTDGDDSTVLERLETECEVKKKPGDALHTAIGMVIDFVCGAASPPAPYPSTYMTQELARSMQEFQGSMSQEVHRGGKPDGSVMADPEMSTFWIMQVVYPSSEDVTLMAIDVKALVVDIEGHSGCLLGLNVFLHINTVTGFNLELVKELDPCYISERHRGAALARMGRRQAEDQEVVETLRQRRINPVTGLPEKHNTASDYLTELSMDEDEKEEFINIVESCGTGEDTDLVALAYGGNPDATDIPDDRGLPDTPTPCSFGSLDDQDDLDVPLNGPKDAGSP